MSMAYDTLISMVSFIFLFRFFFVLLGQGFICRKEYEYVLAIICKSLVFILQFKDIVPQATTLLKYEIPTGIKQIKIITTLKPPYNQTWKQL